MKQIIEIEVPEGKKAIWKDGKVVFEDIKPELPKTWKEFCEKYPVKKEECYINRYSNIFHVEIDEDRGYLVDKTILPSVEAAEAHLALMQLHQLRDCYRQGWVPDWNDTNQPKYCISLMGTTIVISNKIIRNCFLAFQAKEIADEFLHNFESLIKKAGDLI